jgi:hypothetical protein
MWLDLVQGAEISWQVYVWGSNRKELKALSNTFMD